VLEQLVNVYLNLSGEQFAENLVADERSYSPKKFRDALATIRRVLSMSTAERFKNLCELAEQKHKLKLGNDEDFGDEFPEEFRDTLMESLMSNPVRLPSGNYVDEKTIKRHLMSEATDPFTRMPMTEANIVYDPELKARIEKYKEGCRAAKRSGQQK